MKHILLVFMMIISFSSGSSLIQSCRMINMNLLVLLAIWYVHKDTTSINHSFKALSKD